MFHYEIISCSPIYKTWKVVGSGGSMGLSLLYNFPLLFCRVQERCALLLTDYYTFLQLYHAQNSQFLTDSRNISEYPWIGIFKMKGTWVCKADIIPHLLNIKVNSKPLSVKGSWRTHITSTGVRHWNLTVAPSVNNRLFQLYIYCINITYPL